MNAEMTSHGQTDCRTYLLIVSQPHRRQTAQQEANLLRSGVPASDGDLDGHRDGAGHDAPVKCAEEAEGVVVGVDQGHAVTGLDTAKGVSLETDSV